MTAADRRYREVGESPGVPFDEPQAIVLQQFREDLAHWIQAGARTGTRIMHLVETVLRDPFSGIGKPEALKHGLRGRWSRRISDRDRLVYLVKRNATYFIAARPHYEG